MASPKTTLTPEIIEDIRRILPTAMYLETVASFIGVTLRTLQRWLARGRKEELRLVRIPGAKPLQAEAIFLELLQTYQKALADGEIYALGLIRKAAAGSPATETSPAVKGEWQAAAWVLERRYPDRWGRDRKRILELEDEVKVLCARIAELENERVRLAQSQDPALV